MAVKLLKKIDETTEFLKLLWTSDEAHFHLEEKVNSKTNVFWKTSRPNEVVTLLLHSSMRAMWAAISARGINGRMFFEESDATVTVTKERYDEVLDAFKVSYRLSILRLMKQVLTP